MGLISDVIYSIGKGLIASSILIFGQCKLLQAQGNKKFNEQVNWEKGYLDIHHIHTGRGDAAFMIFPDGTTLLFDAGEANQRTSNLYYPIYPDSSKTAGEWLVSYIRQIAPKGIIDYAVLSHFHADHYGAINSSTPLSISGKYKLSGITRVGDAIPIKTLIDRDYPAYDFPMNLREHFLKIDSTFENYLKFVDYQKKNGMSVQALIPGSNRQLVLKYNKKEYPGFWVRNVKSNQRIWSGMDTSCYDYAFNPSLESEADHYSENALSNAIKVNYGSFDYYTGGDLPGFAGKGDYDVETSMAKAIGETDAMALNHHGYKDANNDILFDELHPQVVAHQAIHDPHFQEATIKRMESRHIDAYSIWMSDSIKTHFRELVESTYKSCRGHVLIRVAPGGEFFEVLVVENNGEKLYVRKIYGPYVSRN